MTDPTETLSAIKARAEAATEGPWHVGDANHVHAILGACIAVAYNLTPQDEPDATFIAHARTDVPWLLSEVEKHKAALEAVLAVHEHVTIPPETANEVDNERRHGPCRKCLACGHVQHGYCPTVRAITEALS